MTDEEPRRAPARWQAHLPPLPYAIFGLLLLGAAITGAIAYASPWFAFQALRAAAEAGDLQALDEVIDYGAVQSSLRPQVDARLPRDPPPRPAPTAEPRPRWLPEFVPWPLAPPGMVTGAVDAITRPVERPLRVRRGVERLTTPASLTQLTTGRAHVRDWGWRRFRISTVDEGQETIWGLRRRGWFSHELVHIGLPPVSPSATAAPSSGTPGQPPRP